MSTSPTLRGQQHEWLSVADVADELQVPVRTVRSWRARGVGPQGVRLGRHVRYSRQVVAAWIAAQYAEQGVEL